MSGPLNSASAISAALRIDWAATAALPLADNGRISATLTLPRPMGAACCGVGWLGLERLEMKSPGVVPPVQPDKTAPIIAPMIARTARLRDTARPRGLASRTANIAAAPGTPAAHTGLPRGFPSPH